MQYQVAKTLAVQRNFGVCSAAGGHSAGCRASQVFLQHYAMW